MKKLFILALFFVTSRCFPIAAIHVIVEDGTSSHAYPHVVIDEISGAGITYSYPITIGGSGGSQLVLNSTNTLKLVDPDGIGFYDTAGAIKVIGDASVSIKSNSGNIDVASNINMHNNAVTLANALYFTNGASMQMATSQVSWLANAFHWETSIASTFDMNSDGTFDIEGNNYSLRVLDTGIYVGGPLDVQSHVISSVSDPVTNTDAVNLQTLQSYVGSGVGKGAVTFVNSLTTPVTQVVSGASSTSSFSFGEKGTAVASSFGWTPIGGSTIVFNGTTSGPATVSYVYVK